MRPLILLILLLAGCDRGEGQCEMPGDEAEVRRAIVLDELGARFRSDNVVRPSAASYLAENPGCCAVDERRTGLFDRLFRGGYSAHKYDAQVRYAYRDGASILRYSYYGQADSCGKILDGYGEGEVVDGPTPKDCFPDETGSARGKGGAEFAVSICETTAPPPRAAVPIAEADRLYSRKVSRPSSPR